MNSSCTSYTLSSRNARYPSILQHLVAASKMCSWHLSQSGAKAIPQTRMNMLKVEVGVVMAFMAPARFKLVWRER